MSKKRERKRSVDYGKIAGAVSGRSLAFMDPTIATRRKAEKRELDRKSKMATADMIGGIASGVATAGAAAEANLKSWEEMESGLRAVSQDPNITLQSTGVQKSGVKGALQRMFTSAPAGGAFTIGGESGGKSIGKAFTGTELSQIGKASTGGYLHTIGQEGKSLWESFGGTLADDDYKGLKGVVSWDEKGYKPSQISEWGISSPYNIQGTSSTAQTDI